MGLGYPKGAELPHRPGCEDRLGGRCRIVCIEYIDRVTTVRLATLNDLPQIAQVQMRAFQYDPLITWMLPSRRL